MSKRYYYFGSILLVIICITFLLFEKKIQSKNVSLQKAESIFLNTSFVVDRAGIEGNINWHQLDYKALNQLIDEKSLAGYCGLAATYMARKFKENNFNSISLNFGNYAGDKNKSFSHVLTLVKINKKFYVFDLFYGATIVDKNNNYIDLFTALDDPKKYFYRNIENDGKKFKKKHFVITKEKNDPKCFENTIMMKNHFICENFVKKSFDNELREWTHVKNENEGLYWNYDDGEDIFLSMIKQGIFNIAEYSDKKDFIFLTSEFRKRNIHLHNSVFN